MPTAPGRTIIVPGSTTGSGTCSTAISCGPFHTMAFTVQPPLLEISHKDGACRRALRACELERQTSEKVLPRLDAGEHQPLQDDHVRPEQRVMGVEFLVLERLHGEEVHPHRLDPDLDEVLRGLLRDGRVAFVELLPVHE